MRSFTTVPDLKRSFEREPLRLEVDLGKQAEFLCAPPDGQPPPSVYWRKQDKDQLEGEGEATPLSTETHPNYHISNNGSKCYIKLLTSPPPPPHPPSPELQNHHHFGLNFLNPRQAYTTNKMSSFQNKSQLLLSVNPLISHFSFCLFFSSYLVPF